MKILILLSSGKSIELDENELAELTESLQRKNTVQYNLGQYCYKLYPLVPQYHHTYVGDVIPDPYKVTCKV